MPTVAYDKFTLPELSEYDSVTVRKWTLANGDDGSPLSLPKHADRAFQITGVFSGATVKLEGTINGNDWAPLTDPQGNDLSFTSYPSGYSSKIEAITEAVLSVRPVVSGGDGSTAIVVTVLCRS